MKRLTGILAALIALCLLVPCAAETAEAQDLRARAFAALSDADELVELYEEDLYELMGIEPEDCEDYVYLAARDALSAREVIVIRAVDAEAAERVEGLLQSYLQGRRTETRGYLPDAYALLSGTEVVRRDCLVLLVVGEHADEEIELLTAEE